MQIPKHLYTDKRKSATESRFAGTTKGTSSERQLNNCIVQPATLGATE